MTDKPVPKPKLRVANKAAPKIIEAIIEYSQADLDAREKKLKAQEWMQQQYGPSVLDEAMYWG